MEFPYKITTNPRFPCHVAGVSVGVVNLGVQVPPAPFQVDTSVRAEEDPFRVQPVGLFVPVRSRSSLTVDHPMTGEVERCRDFAQYASHEPGMSGHSCQPGYLSVAHYFSRWYGRYDGVYGLSE